ncbi:hypothetical protein [Pseudalkalibacillus caeni]|uniref:Uncharacterized protein n=1 Tax=Exobacillus caeni TaxID=2574798 RepID=A0A5R9FEC3_9BACL|nr:hypothetical protein [Pseudalkalibacillus caeni]TLS39223.1 hypothetical protein FCL54_02640 [Pseudalkalibacillus caeni]
MKRKFGYNKFRLPPFIYKFRLVIIQFCPPLIVFQLIRTLLFPTTIDVMILIILVCVQICFYLEWI